MRHPLASPGVPSRFVALVESILVTLIWASSFVLVKKALDDLGPLTIAGLRYFLGFLFLLPFMARRAEVMLTWPRGLWLRLFFIGLSAYTIGNGAMFWGLKYLPATIVSFLMSLIPLMVLGAGAIWLQEVPTAWQVVGVVVSLSGGILFFSPGLGDVHPVGLGTTMIGMVGATVFVILSRGIAREREVGTLSLTAIPLAFGGAMLLLIALPLEGIPHSSSLTVWGIVLTLALVNTALGYVLYNHALQTLTALEMHMILNLIPLCTAILAGLLLEEQLAIIQIGGMIIVVAGVMLVQWAGDRKGLKKGGKGMLSQD